ncbi:myosin-11-like isoform X3 [Dromaius novaehollandiae]|uniref:myosin-11-like isoform X3 n=1 Tax=Dromaius novaehollandiae TaxID=8790 RepID=UPI00311F930C
MSGQRGQQDPPQGFRGQRNSFARAKDEEDLPPVKSLIDHFEHLSQQDPPQGFRGQRNSFARAKSEEILPPVKQLREHSEHLRKAVERSTTRALEAMQEETERILSEKLATLQSHVEGAQRTAPSPEELISPLTSTLHNLSQQVQALQRSLDSMQVSMQHDHQHSRADLQGIMSKVVKAAQGSWSESHVAELESKLGKAVERSTTRALEAMQEETERILSEKLATLQSHVEGAQRTAPSPEELISPLTSTLHNLSQQVQALQRSLDSMQVSMQHDHQHSRADLQGIMSKVVKAAQGSWSESHVAELESKLGTAVERSTTRALEAMQEEAERILSEKLATLQSHEEGAQRAAPSPEQLISPLTSTLHNLSQQVQDLQRSLDSMQVSMQRDHQHSRADLQGIMSKAEKAAQGSWSESHVAELESKLGKAVERSTTRALEAMQEETERILSEKLATLQSHVEGAQRTAPSPEELISPLTSTLHNLSQQVQALQRSLDSMQVSMQHDHQHSRADLQGIMSKVVKAAQGSWSESHVAELESKLGKAVERSTTRALEAMQEEAERILSEKLATLQSHEEGAQRASPSPEQLISPLTSTLHNLSQQVQDLQRSLDSMQVSMQRDHQHSRADLQGIMSKAEKAAQGSWSESHVAELESKLGTAVERSTTRALEAMQEEAERILSEKLATLQSHVEGAHHAAPPPQEMTSPLTSTLHNLSQQVQALQRSLDSMQVSMQRDHQHSRADLQGIMSKAEKAAQGSWSESHVAELESKLGTAVERSTTRALEAMQEEAERILSEKLATLQSHVEGAHHAAPPPQEMTSPLTSTLHNLSQQVQDLQRSLDSMQVSMQRDHQHSRADLQGIMSKAEKAAQGSWSESHVAELESKLGTAVERSTTRALEAMQEETERILSEKLAILQSHVEGAQRTAPSPEELISPLTSTLHSLSQQVQDLQRSLDSMQVSMQHDHQHSRADLQGIMSKAEKAAQGSWSESHVAELESKLGTAVERSTTRALEAMQEEAERILSEKLATLQSHVEGAHHAAPPPQEMTSPLTSTLHNLSQQVRALRRSLDSMQVSMQRDHQHSRADLQGIMSKAEKAAQGSWSESHVAELESKLGTAVERSTTRALEAMQEEAERILSEKLATLQSHVEGAHHAAPPPQEMTSPLTSTLHNLSQQVQDLQRSLDSMQVSMQRDHQHSRADLQGIMSKAEKAAQGSWSESHVAELESKLELVTRQRYTVDVTLDADTAHPRLEVSEDGKRVTDTGTIRNVPRTEKRFDSHTFLLAKEGYTSGKRYWEVDVGKRRNWDVGIAREPVARKGTLTLSPKNGFWVIGLADGREYWARTEPWTRLAVSRKPQKIGIFLDTTAKQLSFYDVRKKTAVYTFSLGGDSSQEGKFFPFFSTGSISAKPDTEALKIVQGFDDDE